MNRWARAIVACPIAMLLVWAPSSPGYGRVYPIERPAIILKSDQRTVKVLAFSANGSRIALTGDSGDVEIWDVLAARRLRTIKGSSQVFTLAFSPDGRQLAASSADSKINVWQLEGDELRASFDVPGGPVYSIGYTPDGRRIAAGCKDGLIRLYSVDGQLLHAFGHIISALVVVVSPAGVRIAALESEGLRMWDAETGEIVVSRTLHLLPWLSAHGRHMGLEQNPMFFLSPEADFVAVALDRSPNSLPVPIYTLTLWNAATGQKVIECCAGFGWPSFAVSGRGNAIAESSLGIMNMIDIETGRELHRYYDVVRPFVRSLIFSPDAKWIVSGHDDGVVRIWKADRSPDVGYRLSKRARRHPPVTGRVRGGWPDQPEPLSR
jgi:WD40 repeat protein